MADHYLYIFDDSVNTFQKVYAVLMKELDHLPIQAEQCCLIAHNTGKCHVKTGDVVELQKLQSTLEEYDIKAKVFNEKLI